MNSMMGRLNAPWTLEQVEALNFYQRAGVFHPYTCGTKEKHAPGAEENLLATPSGWVCPSCNYRQNWAHGFSADWEAVKKVEQTLSDWAAGSST